MHRNVTVRAGKIPLCSSSTIHYTHASAAHSVQLTTHNTITRQALSQATVQRHSGPLLRNHSNRVSPAERHLTQTRHGPGPGNSGLGTDPDPVTPDPDGADPASDSAAGRTERHRPERGRRPPPVLGEAPSSSQGWRRDAQRLLASAAALLVARALVVARQGAVRVLRVLPSSDPAEPHHRLHRLVLVERTELLPLLLLLLLML